MKKAFILFLVASLSFTLCSCYRGYDQKSKSELQESNLIAKPEITEYSAGTNAYEMKYYYAVDESTGVVYLVCDGYYGRHGITVAYNADGTVMTKDQIAKE